MTIVRDDNRAIDALAIVEKYEAFVHYLYPIVQRSPRHHGVLRDTVIAELFAPIGDLYHAAKSKQVSRLYAVDARFATLRSYLRFLAKPDIRIVSVKQHAHALALLTEPGRMLGAWQKKLREGHGEMMRPRPSIFGGSWINGSNAGSRYANLPENSNENLGARGRSDDGLLNGTASRTRAWPRGHALRSPTRCLLSCRYRASPTSAWRGGDHGPAGLTRLSAVAGKVGGQPASPASANTHPGPGRAGRSASSGASRPAAGTSFQQVIFRNAMARRYRNLIGRITAPETMARAYRLTSRGKRLTAGYLDFKEYDALNLAQLADDMRGGTYQCGTPHEFLIFDPKLRLISALPFRDRVAQQALCLVIGPLFDRALLPRAFACRPGKGTHAGVVALQSDLRRLSRRGPVYFLKTDFSRYFASIERGTLWRMIEAKISCTATLRLIEAMVPRAGIGLPIGSLTSQIFANLYTGATLDRHLQQTLGEDYWYRYMDDLVVLGRDVAHLRRVKDSIEAFSRDHLGLRGSGHSCNSADEPLPTVTAKARFGMVVPVTHGGDGHKARDVDSDPLPTVTGAHRGELAFITAQHGEREGQAPRVHSLEQPTPTIAATGHVDLVQGTEGYDILFRMLEPHELAAAMGFTTEEQAYEFAGTKTEQIKQIGNAVSVRLMKAHVTAIMADAAPAARAQKGAA